MTGGDPVSAEAPCVVEADAELDLTIAQHVWIGGATGTILIEEVAEDTFAILAGEAHLVQRNAELTTHLACVLKILRSGAVAILILVPIAHEQPLHGVALLQQGPRGDRGVDAAGHPDDHERRGHRGLASR